MGLKRHADIAEPDDVVQLFDMVRLGSNKEARLASLALPRLRRSWSLDDLTPMKKSSDSQLRRRAWWVHRGLGGWEETLADLELLWDNDLNLARHGRSFTPPMYLQPPTRSGSG